MEKKIIAGLAALFLSTGIAAAQSASGSAQKNPGTTASSSTDTRMSADKTAANKRTPGHMSRAEARVNQAEIQETKQLNLDESQQVAAANAKANVSVPGGAMSANEGSSTGGQANAAPNDETANSAASSGNTDMARGSSNGTEAMNNGAGMQSSGSPAPQNPGATGSSEMSNGSNSAGNTP